MDHSQRLRKRSSTALPTAMFVLYSAFKLILAIYYHIRFIEFIVSEDTIMDQHAVQLRILQSLIGLALPD